MIVVDRKEKIGYQPGLFGDDIDLVQLNLIETQDGVEAFELIVPASRTQKKLTVKWKIKALGVKAAWSSNVIFNKRFRTDWELPQVVSSISDDLPVLALVGHQDENVITISCADAVNELSLELAFREEDNHFYCSITFFENIPIDKDYKTIIRIDQSDLHFSHAIKHAADWIHSFYSHTQVDLPALACCPLYSTWYSFHQSLDQQELLQECRIAKTLGYDLIIIDDGWQTLDDGRGYDYTGDWGPDRFADVPSFVDQVHDIGLGIMFWYSVPFCGKKSDAYQRFKGKFLTENHHWAPVFDPRFPEVRDYLVGIYKQALQDWGIDGFKLDFIDDFRIYPETELDHLYGRDTLSVFEGVHRLINEIHIALQAIKSDVLIEFRQKYVGPALQPLGNMFRAFDCPNDSVMNRVRTTDVKLICGEAAVHSDMLTWHEEESPEVAALQLTNVLFSVPQISVRLSERNPHTLKMIAHWTNYWINNKSILLKGQFKAYKPISNYPILSASSDDRVIYGLYDDVLLPIEGAYKFIDIVNGKLCGAVILRFMSQHYLNYLIRIVDCYGTEVYTDELQINQKVIELDCPPNGIIKCSAIS